jgi:mannose-6-phosphate isomerase-like protein (cupin superfamily)
MNANKTKDFDFRQALSVIYQRALGANDLSTKTILGILFVLLISTIVAAQERAVDPTWLHRYLPNLKDSQSDLSSATCHYTAIFGAGDTDARLLRSISRFGEVRVDPRSSCESLLYDREEELYFVAEGTGTIQFGGEPHPLRANDFTYVAPGVKHSVANNSSGSLRVLVMGFKVPPKIVLGSPAPPRVINLDQLKEETVQGHPSSVLYKLLIGPRTGKRDAIDEAYVVTSLFWMNFAPGGTNFPHHHETAEEIYLVIDGEGEMVAGGGMDGLEGRYPTKAGDAYYFRPNCTVGFYNQNRPGAHAHILAVRSRIPLSTEED